MLKTTLATLTLLMSLSAISTPALAGDAEKGARVWMKCRACHTIDEGGRSAIGPNLFGIIDRQSGSVEGFRYSKAMTESDVVWSEENLKAFVASPRTFMRGTKMGFAGIRSEQQIDDLLEFIEEQMGDE